MSISSGAAPSWCRPTYQPGDASPDRLKVIECRTAAVGLCESCVDDFAWGLFEVTEVLEDLNDEITTGVPGAADAHRSIEQALLTGVGFLFDPVEPVPDEARARELLSEFDGLNTPERIADAIADTLLDVAKDPLLGVFARDVTTAAIRAYEVGE